MRATATSIGGCIGVHDGRKFLDSSAPTNLQPFSNNPEGALLPGTTTTTTPSRGAVPRKEYDVPCARWPGPRPLDLASRGESSWSQDGAPDDIASARGTQIKGRLIYLRPSLCRGEHCLAGRVFI